MISAQELREMQSKEEHPHKKVIEDTIEHVVKYKTPQYINKSILFDFEFTKEIREWVKSFGYSVEYSRGNENGHPYCFTIISW